MSPRSVGPWPPGALVPGAWCDDDAARSHTGLRRPPRVRSARHGRLKVHLALFVGSALWLGQASVLALGLHDAVRDGNRAAIQRLLAHENTDVNTSDTQGATALHWAAFAGNATLVEQLLARGARLDVKVANGNTPLHQAAYAGHADIVELLLAAGARVDARNDLGYTPLHWAARNGHRRAAIALLAGGASRDDPASDGDTPRTLARNHGHDEVAQAMMRTSMHDPAPRSTRATASVREPERAVQPLPAAPGTTDAQTRYRVQLAAGRSETAARREWKRLKQRHTDLLGSLGLFIDRTPRSDGSHWYRVRTEPMSQASASQLCLALQERRVSCLVARRH